MATDISKLMKQAEQMKAKMQEAQEQLANIKVQGKSGAADTTVVVTMTGRFDTQKVDISEGAFNSGKEMLEDLLASAFNAGVREVEKASKDKFTALSSDIDLALPEED